MVRMFVFIVYLIHLNELQHVTQTSLLGSDI
jgi:hypothetical protein